MKKYMIYGLIVIVAFSACKKDSLNGDGLAKKLPTAVVNVQQRLTEVSKTKGIAPSIVLIGGFGSPIQSWQGVYEKMYTHSSIFTYNRAGIGLSENVTGVRDAQTIATELKMILDFNQIKPPYVLVAHSMGGIYARMFYHLHPNQVKGIVLVDATHEDQLEILLSQLPPPVKDMVFAEMTAVNDSILNSLPSGSMKEEFRANFQSNYDQIKQFPSISNIPIYVITSTKITADNPAFVIDIKQQLHQQWAIAAGTKGKFVATNKSGHDVHLEEPALVAEGVRWVLSK
jgi:pimeloyl-ACP methyl ester carboxylesterase